MATRTKTYSLASPRWPRTACARSSPAAGRSSGAMDARGATSTRAISPISADLARLRYGVSITDARIGWETTERLLLGMDERLRRDEKRIVA